MSCRKFVLEAPRKRKTLLQNDRFLDEVQQPPCERDLVLVCAFICCNVLSLFYCFLGDDIYISLINNTGRGWVNAFVVTCYNDPLVHPIEIEYI